MVRLHVLSEGVLQASFCLSEGSQWLGSGLRADLIVRPSLAPALLCRVDLTPDGRVVARAADPQDAGAALRLSDGTRAEVLAIPNGDFAEIGGLRLLVLADAAQPAANTPDEVLRELQEGVMSSLRGKSEPMQRVRETVARFAPGDEAVLVTGEPGTGKGLVAGALARLRDSRPPLGGDCSALPADVLECLLFGFRRNAFPGAEAEQVGCFEAADGETVFLDEIGDLPEPLQRKVLAVLEERVVLRLGERDPRPVRFRLVAATRHDLEALAGSGGFHADLSRKVGASQIHVPPLRQHKADIGDLTRAALRSLEGPAAGKTLSHGALDKLRHHDWPGNVEQLLATVKIAALACNELEIPMEAVELPPQAPEPPRVRSLFNLPSHLEGLERAHCLKQLLACGGDVEEAARQIGLAPVHLQGRLDRWGWKKPRETPKHHHLS